MARKFAMLARLILVLAAGAAAQDLPEAGELMRQSKLALHSFRSLQYSVEITQDRAEGSSIPLPKTEVSVAMMPPGKSRVESKSMGAGVQVVSDGQTTWVYQSFTNEYVKMSAAVGSAGLLSAMGLPSFLPDESNLKSEQKVTRAETIQVDGQSHECWVLEVTVPELLFGAKSAAKATDMRMTMWLDRKLKIDLKTDATLTLAMDALPTPMTLHLHMEKKNLKIDQPLPDSLFTFTPPSGAKLVDNMAAASASLRKSDLTGGHAPSFEVKTLEGKAYSAAGFAGKPLLVEFWTTWCGPCRQSMPAIEKLRAAYGERLGILGVNAGEDRETVAAFLKKTPLPYPVALTGDSNILAAYGVEAFPTFVLIGADGTVLAHEVGFAGEAALRAMVDNALRTSK